MTPAYTLRQAAALLGRSERFVWNHVRAGKIEAHKSGKSLVLDASSVIAFARAEGIAVRGDNHSALLPPPPPAPPLQAPRGEPRYRAAREPASRSFTFRELGAYDALRAPAVDALRWLGSLPAGGPGDVRARAALALVDALERLAVGYNAYHLREKTAQYVRAREAACAAASTLVVMGDLGGDAGRAAALAERIEHEAAGAIGGLIRSMERRGEKHERRLERGRE